MTMKVFSRLTLTVGTQHIFGKCIDALNDVFKDRPLEQDGVDAAAFSRNFAMAQHFCLAQTMLPGQHWIPSPMFSLTSPYLRKC